MIWSRGGEIWTRGQVPLPWLLLLTTRNNTTMVTTMYVDECLHWRSAKWCGNNDRKSVYVHTFGIRLKMCTKAQNNLILLFHGFCTYMYVTYFTCTPIFDTGGTVLYNKSPWWWVMENDGWNDSQCRNVLSDTWNSISHCEYCVW